MTLTPFLLFAGILVFWMLIMRPQRQRRALQARLRAELKDGDEVMTIGGLFGVIREVGDNYVVLEIAPETRVRLAKSAVTAREEGTETPGTSLP